MPIRVVLPVILLVSGCTCVWAQSAVQVFPRFEVQPPVRYRLAPPAPPNAVYRVAMKAKPCAAARVMHPNPRIDSRIFLGNPQPGSLPVRPEAHSHDIGEADVPAPSCADPR